jgi:hypothetical protein
LCDCMFALLVAEEMTSQPPSALPMPSKIVAVVQLFFWRSRSSSSCYGRLDCLFDVIVVCISSRRHGVLTKKSKIFEKIFLDFEASTCTSTGCHPLAGSIATKESIHHLVSASSTLNPQVSFQRTAEMSY